MSHQHPRPRRCLSGGRMAFTMVELLVVLLILTALVTMVIGVGKYLSQEQDRKLTEMYQTMIMTAIRKHYDLTGTVPANPPPLAPGETYDPALIGVSRPDGMTNTQWEIYARNALMYDALESQTECIAIISKLPDNVILRGQLASGQPPAFLDAYGKYMDYLEKGGYGGPLLISGGPDGYMGGEHVADDIRSDGRAP